MTETDFINNCITLRKENYFDFLSFEGDQFYKLEDSFITNKLMLSDTFQYQVRKLKEKNVSIKTLKTVVKPVIEHFFLSDVKIKITRSKSGDSYYQYDKNTIFLHQHLFDDIKDIPNNHNYYEELLYYFYHELAHAYTNLFVSAASSHDSNYVYCMSKIFSFITNDDFESFLNEIVNLDIYENNPLWNDDFSHLSFSKSGKSDVKKLLTQCRDGYPDNNKIIKEENDFEGTNSFHYKIILKEANGSNLLFLIRQITNNDFIIVSYSGCEYFLNNMDKIERLYGIKKAS